MTEGESHFQVLYTSQEIKQKYQRLQKQVSDIRTARQTLQAQNNRLKNELANKQNLKNEYAWKLRQLSKRVLILSKRLISKQEQSNQEKQLRQLVGKYQRQIKKLRNERDQILKTRQKVEALYKKQIEQNQKFKLQLKNLELTFNKKIEQFKTSELKKYIQSINAYQAWVKKESEKNVELQSKVYQLETQLNLAKKYDNNEKLKNRKHKSQTINI